MTNTLSNTKVKPFSALKFRKNTDSIWHGNVVDKKAVVSQFGYYVRSIARKILRTLSSCIELDDLISYGMMGLLEAAERYDPKKGVSFTTFSYYRIKGAIYDGLRGMGWLSRSEYQKIRFGEKANSYLESSSPERAKQSKTSPKQDSISQLATKVSGLATIYITSLESAKGSELEDKSLVSQENKLVSNEMNNLVKQSLLSLSLQERKLVTLYYFKNLSLQQVGDKIGLSKSWTCRKHAQIIDKLSKIMQQKLNNNSDNFRVDSDKSDGYNSSSHNIT